MISCETISVFPCCPQLCGSARILCHDGNAVSWSKRRRAWRANHPSHQDRLWTLGVPVGPATTGIVRTLHPLHTVLHTNQEYASDSLFSPAPPSLMSVSLGSASLLSVTSYQRGQPVRLQDGVTQEVSVNLWKQQLGTQLMTIQASLMTLLLLRE